LPSLWPATPEHYLELPAFYQAKRDRFRALLKPSRLKLLDVPGGYFQLVDYSAIRDEDDLAFSRWLVQHAGVAAIPLTPFYDSAPGTRLAAAVLCQERRDDGCRGGASMSALNSPAATMHPLKVSLVQGATRWHDAPANRDYYGALVRQLKGSDLIVLPETFLSGFSNDTRASAETMDGEGVAWLRALAIEVGAVICGSLAIREGDTVYNRLLWVRPDGSYVQYDKRHLFRMAGEHTRYGGGNERLIVELKGWRILPQVCYDLRFPGVAAQSSACRCANGGMEYDLALFVANWPAPRRQPWRTLLRARAIENLSYVIGVNRVGVDGNELPYAGDSAVIDPVGEPLVELGAKSRW
jgi:omega-amidase